MSLVPVDLQSIAERIHATGESEIITPRTLAGYFNAQRRTSYTVWRIRRALEEVKLVTHPSFEIVYMDTTGDLPGMTEIIELTPTLEARYTEMYQAARTFDGRDPIRRR